MAKMAAQALFEEVLIFPLKFCAAQAGTHYI
jgi:hypothetical protein